MIRTLKTPKLSILLALFFLLPLAIAAQELRPAGPPPDIQTGPPNERKPNLLLELGLSREQIQAMRRLNAERKPIEQEARRRFQEANREMSSAIYADTTSDEIVQSRLMEFQAAQAELARIKFTNELAVRRLLTPDQLVKFRAMRQKFAEVRENMEQRGVGPRRRLRRGNQPSPVN